MKFKFQLHVHVQYIPPSVALERSVINSGVLFIMSNISSAVCDLTEAMPGGIEGAVVGSAEEAFSLIPKGVSLWIACAPGVRPVEGALLRLRDSSKSSGSSSMRTMVARVLGIDVLP